MQGILLAAGVGRRFANSVESTQQVTDKLLNTLPNQSETILELSASALIAVLPNSIAVVQAYQVQRADLLTNLGFQVLESSTARLGMGHAIADAVQQSEQAQGWLIALADMPWVSSGLIKQLSGHLVSEKSIVAPRFNGRRGQPVAFGRYWFSALSRLEGDTGARALLQKESVTWLDWSDDCIHRDIDTVADLSF